MGGCYEKYFSNLSSCGNLSNCVISLPTDLQLFRRSQDTCALCEYGMTYVFSFLNDTTDQHEIQNVLDTVCYHMPLSIRNECQKLVAEFTVPIIQYIVDGYTPDQVWRILL